MARSIRNPEEDLQTEIEEVNYDNWETVSEDRTLSKINKVLQTSVWDDLRFLYFEDEDLQLLKSSGLAA